MGISKIIRSGSTRSQLAAIYNVDEAIIREWLKEIGVQHQKRLKPIELARFIKSVGLPDSDVVVRLPALNA